MRSISGSEVPGAACDLEDEMAFAKIRQEFPAGRRQPGATAARMQISDHHGDDGARPAGNESEHAAVAGFQPVLELRFGRLLHALVEKQVRQRRA